MKFGFKISPVMLGIIWFECDACSLFFCSSHHSRYIKLRQTHRKAALWVRSNILSSRKLIESNTDSVPWTAYTEGEVKHPFLAQDLRSTMRERRHVSEFFAFEIRPFRLAIETVVHFSTLAHACFRSNFTDEKQIPSWIAHGTLLGWWWGGSLLPWDTDVDVQMNANFLYVLARFNSVVLSDRYLIDVNAQFRARHPQNRNRIDARLVDKHTGYFVDITGVANTGAIIPSDPQKLVLYDKHTWRALYSDLYPLVRIEFEGIATWRPYHVEKCLTEEYGPQALVKTTYRGYNYDPAQEAWIGNGLLRGNWWRVFLK